MFVSEQGANINIWRMNADGSHRKQLTDADFDVDPAWSPNGQLIAFVRVGAHEDELIVINAKGGDLDEITTATGMEDVSWISNNKILFARDEDIWTINVNGSNPAPVKTTAATEFEPDWSHARQRIVFTRARPDAPNVSDDLYTMKLDGSGVEQLTNTDSVDETDPDWKPDGSVIAFQRDPPEGYGDIFTIKPNKTGLKRLTHNFAEDEEPAHSPDGEFIVFETRRNGTDNEIWKMKSDGSNETEVTDNHIDDHTPDWQPLH